MRSTIFGLFGSAGAAAIAGVIFGAGYGTTGGGSLGALTVTNSDELNGDGTLYFYSEPNGDESCFLDDASNTIHCQTLTAEWTLDLNSFDVSVGILAPNIAVDELHMTVSTLVIKDPQGNSGIVLTDDGTTIDASVDGQLTIAGIIHPPAAIPSTTIDWAGTTSIFTKTLSGNTTFSFSNDTSGQTIVVAVTTTGAQAATFPAGVQWQGGSEPADTAGGTDIYSFMKIGSTIYGTAGLNFL